VSIIIILVFKFFSSLTEIPLSLSFSRFISLSSSSFSLFLLLFHFENESLMSRVSFLSKAERKKEAAER